MSPSLLDHFLAVLLIVLLPFEGRMEMRSLISSVRHGVPGARVTAFVRTISMQWILVTALLLGWLAASRDWDLLGIRNLSLAGSAVGALAAALTLALVVVQYRGVKRLSPERLAKFAVRSADTLSLLPTTPLERNYFAALAITAGICEEVLCRGFLFWYLSCWLSPWLVFVVASALFGAAHMYQGPKGVVRTAICGAFLGGIYWLSGSLWWAMLTHAIIDLGALPIASLLAPRPESRPECSAAPAA